MRDFLLLLELYSQLSQLKPMIVAQSSDCFNASATFYDDYYEGRQTANGETFTNSGYTAAIADWRGFGSYRVTNQYTGAYVDVYANDRGDFGDNIDLAQAAFGAIGNLDSGRLDVQVCKL